jgi:hypothetical protein
MPSRNKLSRSLFGAVLLAAGFTAGGPALRAEEKLVAPSFPGAIRLSSAKAGNMAPVEFAVKEAHDEVAAFYVPRYGRPAGEGEADRTSSNMTSIVCVSLEQVRKIILAAKGDITLERPALVSIEWMPEILGPSNTVNRIFMELESQAKKFNSHQAEIPELKKKYAFLQTSYYQGGKDQEILRRYGLESGNSTQTMSDPKALKAYADEMTKLTQEGKYDQLAGLRAKYFGDQKEADKRRKSDNFGLWTKALDDLAAVSYQTKLSIDIHPGQWNVAWEKNR